MRKSWFITVILVLVTVWGFQNCAPGANFTESASTDPEAQGETPTPPAPPTSSLPITACGANKVRSPNGACICDFNNGYYENASGLCEKASAIQDLCAPRPARCGSVGQPATGYVFDFNSASLSSSEVSFSSTASRLTRLSGSQSLVQESVCGTNRKVLQFGRGAGLKFIAGLVAQNYSVAVLFRFNYQDAANCSGTWARILDLKQNSVDTGLYMYGSGTSRNLQFYNFNSGTARVSSNQYAWVTYSKNGGEITGFVNRQLQWSYGDSGSWSTLNSSKEMIFFKDDTQVANEECSGAVAKIVVFNQALSKDQAECLAF
ncbi:MAG: hypothetical protein KF767_04635 [Bdellovibrionaceae bacterium]|nr:hypothetical protein [Pseudobdellovibrionaceae bacterium]